MLLSKIFLMMKRKSVLGGFNFHSGFPTRFFLHIWKLHVIEKLNNNNNNILYITKIEEKWAKFINFCFKRKFTTNSAVVSVFLEYFNRNNLFNVNIKINKQFKKNFKKPFHFYFRNLLSAILGLRSFVSSFIKI